MSTHNIGFYEDLTKIIFELSSNIIKYAPCYFFCCYFAAINFRIFVFMANCKTGLCKNSVQYVFMDISFENKSLEKKIWFTAHWI